MLHPQYTKRRRGGCAAGRQSVAAVEIKRAASVAQHDIRGLASLRDTLGDQFVLGVVVYTERDVIPMGDRLFAVPIGMMFAG